MEDKPIYTRVLQIKAEVEKALAKTGHDNISIPLRKITDEEVEDLKQFFESVTRDGFGYVHFVKKGKRE